MPELPEVETTRLGLIPHLTGQCVQAITIRQARLRWPITPELGEYLTQQRLHSIERRAKYLLFAFDTGWLLIHLGMSGSLRIVTNATAPGKHDHVDILFSQHTLRYTDPRRFGAIVWLGTKPEHHHLLKQLGPEPLSAEFNATYLSTRASKHRVSVKQLIMNQHIVTGVGNIYANEALFVSGIRPDRLANSLHLTHCQKLVSAIQRILAAAITQGGTTLRDFTDSNGKPGYFKQQLQVYGRAGLACMTCQAPLQSMRINNRATVFCEQCQS